MALNVSQMYYFFGTKLSSVFVAKKRTWLSRPALIILQLKVSVQFSDS